MKLVFTLTAGGLKLQVLKLSFGNKAKTTNIVLHRRVLQDSRPQQLKNVCFKACRIINAKQPTSHGWRGEGWTQKAHEITLGTSLFIF